MLQTGDVQGHGESDEVGRAKIGGSQRKAAAIGAAEDQPAEQPRNAPDSLAMARRTPTAWREPTETTDGWEGSLSLSRQRARQANRYSDLLRLCFP